MDIRVEGLNREQEEELLEWIIAFVDSHPKAQEVFADIDVAHDDSDGQTVVSLRVRNPKPSGLEYISSPTRSLREGLEYLKGVLRNFSGGQ